MSNCQSGISEHIVRAYAQANSGVVGNITLDVIGSAGQTATTALIRRQIESNKTTVIGDESLDEDLIYVMADEGLYGKCDAATSGICTIEVHHWKDDQP